MFGSLPVERPLSNYERPVHDVSKEADRADQPFCSPDVPHSANEEIVPVRSGQALPPVAVIAEPEAPVPPNVTPVIPSVPESPVRREFVAVPVNNEAVPQGTRPTRKQTQKKFYDPSSGTYVDGNPKGT